MVTPESSLHLALLLNGINMQITPRFYPVVSHILDWFVRYFRMGGQFHYSMHDTGLAIQFLNVAYVYLAHTNTVHTSLEILKRPGRNMFSRTLLKVHNIPRRWSFNDHSIHPRFQKAPKRVTCANTVLEKQAIFYMYLPL